MATLDGKTAGAPLTVLPPDIKRVEVGAGPPVPNVFSGGASELGTVVFHGCAPSGSVIALASSSPSASVPASITTGGPSYNTFSITTSQVAATTTVSITATWKGQSVPVSITLHPPPTLLSPATNASFAIGTSVLFEWNDLPGLTFQVQVDDSSSFTAPLLVDQYSSQSPFAWSTLPSGTLYWRIAGRDAYGQLGPWSAVRPLRIN
jgi:hypothetical protein